MGRSDAVTQVGRLVVMFGKEDISEERVSGYVDELEAIEPKFLKAAVDQIIRNETFFPTIGQINRAVAEVGGLLPPTPAEMADVRRRGDVTEIRGADRGGRGYVEKFYRQPEGVNDDDWELCQLVTTKCGESSDMEGKPYFGYETGFKQTYETVAETITKEVLADLPRALKAGSYMKLIEAHNPKLLTE